MSKVAVVSGRYYAMDRDNRWERVKLAYDAIANGIGNNFKTVQKAIETSYEAQEFDEFVKPVVITNAEDEPIAKVAAVEWVKELWRLNKETNNNLLDFLTTAESMYTEIANNLNVESQYQQQ